MEKLILFNTDMVHAVLDGRKRGTRRTVKKSVWENFVCEGGKAIYYLDKKTGSMKSPLHKAPYQARDILYVRETWCNANKEGCEPDYYYLADTRICEDYDESEWVWRPSIHMPKAAARIWLKVTGVTVARLHDMTLDDFLSEGVVLRPEAFNDPDNAYLQAREIFKGIWDSTVRKNELARHGWEADPWVWAVRFERCGKPAEV